MPSTPIRPASQPNHDRRPSLPTLGAVAAAFLVAACGTSARMEALAERGPAKTGGAAGTAVMAQTLSRAFVTAAFREPVNYAVTGVALGIKRPSELVVGNLPAATEPGSEPPSNGTGPGSLAFEARLDEAGIPAPVPGKLTCIVDGDRFFRAFDEACRGATESIRLQTFIFDNDPFAVDLANKLRERAREIDVRVIYDDLGTALASRVAPVSPAPEGFTAPATIAEVLKSPPADLQFRRSLNPWLVADHTKLYQVDGRRAFVGGMNIGREYLDEWHDLMVEVEGEANRSLASLFDDRWNRCRFPGTARRSTLARDPLPPADPPHHGVRILRTNLTEARFEIYQVMLEAIRSSCRRVWVHTPYFSSDSVERALLEAAGRGVDVRLIIPGGSNSTIMSLANAQTGVDLVAAGARVYKYPGMSHLKAMVCDDWAMVGSANCDTLSLAINRELNLATAEPGFVQELVEEVFLKDFRASTRFNEEDGAGLTPRLAEALADQL